MVKEIYSIGVYGSTEETFFQGLLQADIDLFCDVRSRRGMRGGKYAYVNSSRLISRLDSMGIRYMHLKSLGPTKEIRLIQKVKDASSKLRKQERSCLDPAFIQRYEEEVLSQFDLAQLMETLHATTEKVVFFCVERHPEACHRSLIVNRLSRMYNLPVRNLIP